MCTPVYIKRACFRKQKLAGLPLGLGEVDLGWCTRSLEAAGEGGCVAASAGCLQACPFVKEKNRACGWGAGM